jgi:putative transposase
VPPCARRSPQVTELLALLYLHGLSTKDFVPALAEFFGTQAGLSAPVISRLSSAGRPSGGPRTFGERDLPKSRYV